MVSYLTRGKYCCIELPAIYVRMKAHTAGIFQNNIFLSLTAQAKIRKNLLPKGKRKSNYAKVVLFVQLCRFVKHVRQFKDKINGVNRLLRNR